VKDMEIGQPINSEVFRNCRWRARENTRERKGVGLVREPDAGICLSGSMSGCGNGAMVELVSTARRKSVTIVLSTATAPHLDSTTPGSAQKRRSAFADSGRSQGLKRPVVANNGHSSNATKAQKSGLSA